MTLIADKNRHYNAMSGKEKRITEKAISGLVQFVNRNARANKAGVFLQLITCVLERRSTILGNRQKNLIALHDIALAAKFPDHGTIGRAFWEKGTGYISWRYNYGKIVKGFLDEFPNENQSPNSYRWLLLELRGLASENGAIQMAPTSEE